MINPRIIVQNIKDTKDFKLVDTNKLLDLSEIYQTFGEASRECHEKNLVEQPEYSGSMFCGILSKQFEEKMNQKEMIKVLRETVEGYAKNFDSATVEDYEPCSYSGGNFDDAYYNGIMQGQGEIARAVLEVLDRCTPRGGL